MHGTTRGENGQPIEDSNLILASSTTYKLGITSNNIAERVVDTDTKLELRWNGQNVGELLLGFLPPIPDPLVTHVHVRMETTENDLDEGANLTFAIVKKDFQTRSPENLPRDGIPPHEQISEAITVHGPVPDTPNDVRIVVVKILDDKKFKFKERLNYGVFVAYNNSKGEDPHWIGKLSAELIFNNGDNKPVLSDTGDFELGHHNNRTDVDKVVRVFPFNQ